MNIKFLIFVFIFLLLSGCKETKKEIIEVVVEKKVIVEVEKEVIVEQCPVETNLPVIYLGFDDYYENWDYILNNYNDVEFTFFLNGGWSDLAQRLVEKGHKIGNHTRTHINLKEDTNFWPHTLENEILSLNRELKEKAEIKTFAFPFGAFNTHWQAVLVEHFSHLRRFGTVDNKPVYYEKPSLDGVVILSSSSVDNVYFDSDVDFYDYVDSIIIRLVDNGGSVILTGHDIGDSDFAITQARLDYLVHQAKLFGIEFKGL